MSDTVEQSVMFWYVDECFLCAVDELDDELKVKTGKE